MQCPSHPASLPLEMGDVIKISVGSVPSLLLLALQRGSGDCLIPHPHAQSHPPAPMSASGNHFQSQLRGLLHLQASYSSLQEKSLVWSEAESPGKQYIALIQAQGRLPWFEKQGSQQYASPWACRQSTYLLHITGDVSITGSLPMQTGAQA